MATPCAWRAQIQFDQFRRLGLNVIIPDYVGYGMSGGRPSERGCEDTALAVYDYLTSNRSIPSSQILAGGWSLGAAVAIDLASRKPVAGLMVFSAFTSGVDMGRRLLPFLPVSLLLHHRFDNLSKIHQVGCPILIGHGRLDSMIPFSMAEKLAAAAKSPVTTLWIAQADHNDFFDVAGRRVDDAISEFVGRIFALRLFKSPAHQETEPGLMKNGRNTDILGLRPTRRSRNQIFVCFCSKITPAACDRYSPRCQFVLNRSSLEARLS